jgi:hypothetical protein
MADLSLKRLEDGLMKAVKIAAFSSGQSQRDFVVGVLGKAVGYESPVTREGAGEIRTTGASIERSGKAFAGKNDFGNAAGDGGSGIKASPGRTDEIPEHAVKRIDKKHRRVDKVGEVSGRTRNTALPKKMSTEEFLKLSNSDKMRARREERY